MNNNYPECGEPLAFTGDVKYEVNEKQLTNKIKPEKIILFTFIDYECSNYGTEVLIKRTSTYKRID